MIFLDVDGVLNCCLSRWELLPDVGREGTKICPEATARLKRLVDATDARIVVSSTWRKYFMAELTLWLHRHGIDRKRVIGRTPDSAMSAAGIFIADTRGGEIQAWLNEHPEVERFVILDDGADMGTLLPHLVQTTWGEGLLDGHINAAIARLAGALPSPAAVN